MIARDKDLKRIIVSNGIIVDKAFERINEDDISASQVSFVKLRKIKVKDLCYEALVCSPLYRN